MSTNPLFDLSKCSVPFIESVDFRFISECSIKPPPPPIFDCPEPPKTFRVVPECPSIAGSVTVSADAAGCITPRKNIVVTKTARCGGNEEAGCDFFIDLDLAIPVPVPPCPSISAGSVRTSVFYEGCKQPKNSIRITQKKASYNNCEDKKSKPGCLFKIDIDLDIPIPRPPCPSIVGGSVKTSVFYKGCKQPKNSIKIREKSLPKNCENSKPNCRFDIDIDLDIPIPRPPCPSIGGGSVSVSVTLENCKKKNKITVRKKEQPENSCTSNKPNCSHTIDLDLTIPVPLISCPSIAITDNPGPKPSITRKKIQTASCGNALRPPRCEFVLNIPPPPCPSISVGSASIKELDPGKKPSVKLRVKKESTSNCVFTIDLDIGIPKPPCPSISVGSASIKELEPGKKPSIKLQVKKKESTSNCAFTIDLDIGIPKPPCPEFSIGSQSIKQLPPDKKPSVKLKPRRLEPKSGSSCRFALDINIGIPLPPCPEFSTGSQSVKELEPGKKPSVKLTARKLEPKSGSSCRFALDIEIGIPVPTCPEISVSRASVKELKPYEKPSVKLKTNKRAPKSGSSCRFAIDLEIGIPLPPPCVRLSRGSQSIKQLAPGKKPSVRLTPRKLPPKSNSSCNFVFDIDIGIPIPPCPEFSKGSQSIKELEPGKKPSVKLTARKLDPKSGSSCRFALDIEIGIPIPPCPEFSKGSQSIRKLAPGKKPSVKLTTRKLDPKSGSSCRFALDIDIGIPVPPCPEFSKGSRSIKLLSPKKKGSVKLTARKLDPKSDSSCRFALDIDIGIPVPPCVEISKGSRSIKLLSPKQKGNVKLTARKLDPKTDSSCRFALDIDIDVPVPPCVDISAGKFVVSVGDPDEYKKPSGKLSIRRRPTKSNSSCRFAIDFDLTVPVPKQSCPSISIRGRGAKLGKFVQAQTPDDENPLLLPGRCKYTILGSYASVRASKGKFNRVDCPDKESIKIRVTKKVDDLNYTYFLKPEIWVRQPKKINVKKGTVKCAWAECTVENPSCKMSLRKTNTSCSLDWFIDLDIKIPKPITYTGGAIDLGGYGTGQISVGTEGCERPITGTIDLNTTSCATTE